MCGRFALQDPKEAIKALFRLEAPSFLVPQYNVAPGATIVALRGFDPFAEYERRDQAKRVHLFPARWGLIPSWMKEPCDASVMFNARAETIAEKRSFKTPWRRRRCLVPVNLFYEWKRAGEGAPKKTKPIPHAIGMEDGGPFALGGLWERWLGADGSDVETVTIVTVPANGAIRDLHHRMPLILDRNHYRTWLYGDRDEASPLLQPYQGKRTICHWAVEDAVSNARNQSPDLALPRKEEEAIQDLEGSPKDHGQMSLF